MRGTHASGWSRRPPDIPPLLADYLGSLLTRHKFTGGEDFVFASSSGRAMAWKNLLTAKVEATRKALGFKLGWHTFRRTFDTLADQVGMPIGERQAIMGHSDQAMTMRYTKMPSEQARAATEKMANLISQRPN